MFKFIIYKAIQWIVGDQAAVQRGTASVCIHSYPEHLALHQGLYKVAEAIGTMIQNIKYISIYKYTAEDWGPGKELWVPVSQQRAQKARLG